MPRYTNDPKQTTIKLRLNEEMKKFVEVQSSKKSMTISEYIRYLISKEGENV